MAEYYFKNARFLVLNGVKDSETIPEHLKEEIYRVINHQFQAMQQIVGAVCLAHIRAIQHFDEFNKDGSLKV